MKSSNTFHPDLHKPLLPHTAKIDEQLNTKLKKWLQTLLIKPPETNVAEPVDIRVEIAAHLSAASQPAIKAFTGFYKASLISQCMPFNIFLVVCRAISGYATGGTGTYEDMTDEKKEKDRRNDAYDRMEKHIKAQVSITPLTEEALNQLSPASMLVSPKGAPGVDSTRSMGDQSTSVGTSGSQTSNLTTETLSNTLDTGSYTTRGGKKKRADSAQLTESIKKPPFSRTQDGEEKRKEAIREKLKQTLTAILELNLGTGDWRFLFKGQPEDWFSNVTNHLLEKRTDVVFGEWEKLISHFITPCAWISGSVFSCLTAYSIYMVSITAFCFPPCIALFLTALTLALSMIVAMTFYRSKISEAFLKLGKNLDNGGFYGLLVKENIRPSLIALSSAITIPPFLFMNIHAPLMALALQIGITASIMNPIGVIICTILVAIATVTSIAANHSQASKCDEYFKKLKERYYEQKGVLQTAIFCFAALVAIVVSTATLAISVFGDVGGFRYLTHADSATTFIFGALSLASNASFMIADTLYKTTDSLQKSCKGAVERWGFFPSPQAGSQTESSEAKAPLTATPGLVAA